MGEFSEGARRERRGVLCRVMLEERAIIHFVF